MAVRVTAKDVKGILDSTELTTSEIEVYIGSANAIVNEVLGTGDTAILKEIERWLTGHLISISRERTAVKETAGDASITYTGVFGMGLKGTHYGQIVLAMDTTGKFASLAGKAVKITAIESFD